MKFLKKMTAIVTAATMLAVGNIGILPRDAVRDFMLSVRAADSDIVASGECGAQGDNLTWTLDSEGTLTISGEGEMADWEVDSNAPWYSYKDNIVNVIIKEGITSIGKGAFASCDSLTSITIPDSIKYIGDEAFFNCQNLASIIIPDGVASIGIRAFAWCDDLISITIPDTVTSIGEGAFFSCASLTSITLPDSIISIGGYAFRGCVFLETLKISDNVKFIGSCAFSDCFILSDVYYSGTEEEWNAIIVGSGNERLYDSDVTIHYNYNSSETEIINSGTCGANGDNLTWTFNSEGTLTISGEGEMEDWEPNSKLPWEDCDFTNVIIKEGVTSIGSAAFYSCNTLNSITIPYSVTSINFAAFLACPNLMSINVDTNNKYYATEDDVLFNKNKTALIHYPTGKTEKEYVIPDSVTSIGYSAFYGCNSLTSITIPEGVTSIGDWTFISCANLTSIMIPDSVIDIGEQVFVGCHNLIDVYYLGTKEEWNAITIESGNDRLYDSDVTIHYNYNSSETEIINSGTCGAQGDNLTWTLDSEGTLTINGDGEMIDCGYHKSYWYSYESIRNVVIDSGVTSIGDYAFDTCINLTTIEIPDGVTNIGYGAFFCSGLTNITIPNSVTSIKDNAFWYCTSLTDVYYTGTEEEWNAITIEDYNENLTNATIHFNFKLPDSEKQSVYQFFNMPLSWNRAKEYCESLNGHLAVISSAEEQAVIDEQIPNISKNCYWIGAYLENDEWKWVTDEPFEYENWGENLPDNHQGSEKYVHMYAKDNIDESPARLKGEWNDCGLIDKTTPSYNFYSNHNFGFICEWDDESLVPDNSEIDSKIYGYLDILEYNPFYFGSTETIEILHEYKEMAKADPEVETYHFWKNLSNSIDGDVNEDEYNEKMTVEAILAEIFLNKELNDAFTKNAEKSAIEAQTLFLNVLVDNAEMLGIREEQIGYIESLSSTTKVLLDNKKIASVLELVKSEKVPEIFNKLGEYAQEFGKLSDAIGFFQICYKGFNNGVENATQLYNLYIACVSYHTSNMEFRKAVSLMSASVEEEIAKYTGNDDFSHRMRRVGKLYLDYYNVMLDESMAAYDDFASSITSNTLLGTRVELFVFSIKAIISKVFPGLTAAELVLDIGVSIWEATSDIDERSLERDKLLNMILFYDSFSNALYSENGFYGMLKENPTEESYKTLVIGIKMHTITENMLIEYAINYSHMLKRALSEWKRQFALIINTDYVKPVFKARYPTVNVKGESVTRCWRTLDQDMCDDDIQLLKLKKVYMDTDGFDSIKNICNLNESEATQLGEKYVNYYFLLQDLTLYSIFCPVNILIKKGDEIVAIVENDIVTYNNDEIFIDIYKESNYENAYKYIKLPKGYNLEITGYADGEMSFEKAVIENGSVIEISNIEEIPVTAGSVYNEVIEGNKTIALECDLDNDGIVDQTVNAIEEEILLGDVTLDGIINGSDATLTLSAYTIISSGSKSSLNEAQTKAADVDGDGIITGSDATLILRYYTMLSSGTIGGDIPTLEEWLVNQ